MEIIDDGICSVKGVLACGIKDGKNGLALISAEGTVAGVFTQNKVKAAPVIVTSDHIKSGCISGIIVNSGCANAFTGEEGIKKAENMCGMAAEALNADPKSMAVASTGVIGRQLDMALVESQFNEIKDKLTSSKEAGEQAANAIMTTDTKMKQCAVKLENGVMIGGVAKGAGMIEPDMATMLCFLYTDASISADVLQKCLKTAVGDSFNMLVIDGDTSTNDMVLITATGLAGEVSVEDFQDSLNVVCIMLAKMIAGDGEGATKLMEVTVEGAKTRDDARCAAKAVARSPLVKTAVFGEDPNWGRVIAALGNSSAEIEPDKISLWLEGGGSSILLVDKGRTNGDLAPAIKIMKSAEIRWVVDLALGDGNATAWGCDLSDDYVRVNAKYTS